MVNLALALAVGAAVLWIVFTLLTVDGPIWPLVGLLGAAGAILAGALQAEPGSVGAPWRR